MVGDAVVVMEDVPDYKFNGADLHIVEAFHRPAMASEPTKIDVEAFHRQATASEPTEVDVEAVQKKLDYRFNNADLLVEALTHKSLYYHMDDVGPNKDRLEFLGDANLGCVVATELFLKYPSLNSGDLTRIRAVNVDTEKLARAALEHELYRFLRHKIPDFQSQIERFKEEIAEYPTHSYGLVYAPKILADMVESVLGAIFIDSNRDHQLIWKVYLRLVKPLIDSSNLGNSPVVELNELCQKRGLSLKYEDQWREKARINVLVDDTLVGSGTYKNRRDIAQNRAAKVALQNLKFTTVTASSFPKA